MTINKAQLHEHCLALLTERIRELEEAVANVQESRNNETKSSAGDKYETSRAMMQQEEDKLLARLDNTRQMQLQLQQLNPTQQQESAEMGALITTNQRTYYLGVSLGKVILESDTIFCISREAPLAGLLWQKKAGDSIEINGRKEQILAIF